MAIYVRDEKGVLQALDIPAYKGEKGEAGITPNLQVGDVVTLEAGQQATIVRRGNDENPIFDFAIPKGDNGKDGIFVGRVDDAPDHAQVVVNDDASPYDLFYEDSNVDYMGNVHTSLKEKADADIEYLLREIQTQHYEGQRITATNTYQKQVRSAILKGNTLVNLVNYKGFFDGREINSDNTFKIDATKPFQELIIGKEYTFIAYVSQTAVGNMSVVAIEFNEKDTGIKKALCIISNPINGVNKVKFTVPSNYGSYLHSYIKTSSVGGSVTVKGMIIEGDHTNEDIPYFEGMQSVRMPVLNSYNWKQLFDGQMLDGITLGGSGGEVGRADRSTSSFIEIEPSTQYTIANVDVKVVLVYDSNKVVIQQVSASGTATFTTNSSAKYVRFSCTKQDKYDIKMVEGTEVPVGEHKTNILTVNEDVELRGIGDVQDELDLLTGELTQRIEEVILNGETTANGYTSVDSYIGQYARHLSKLVDGKNEKLYFQGFVGNIGNSKDYILTNGFVQYKGFKPDNSELEEGLYRYGGSNHAYICISASRFTEHTFEGIKKFLSENPQSYLVTNKESVVKTVDLNNQKVYSYDGTTHYTTSSGVEGHLAPILSIDVPTNLPALVSRQRDTIKDLEKENEALKEEVAVVDQQRETGDLELLSSDFDLDFRLMEIEFALDIPIAATFKEVRNMARTPYEMAKILILGGKYERSDMEYKLGKYLERKQITQAQYDELIALMEANELVV